MLTSKVWVSTKRASETITQYADERATIGVS